MAAVATNRAENPRCDLASDPIRMIFPPNALQRRSIAPRSWRASPEHSFAAGSEQVLSQPANLRDTIETRFKISSPQRRRRGPGAVASRRACNAPRNRLSDRFRRKSQNLQQIPNSFPKLPTFALSGVVGRTILSVDSRRRTRLSVLRRCNPLASMDLQWHTPAALCRLPPFWRPNPGFF